MDNLNKEKTLDERLEYLTKQFELLLAKEIERNKELQADRKQRDAERDAEIKQREADLKQREKDKVELNTKYVQDQAEREANYAIAKEKSDAEFRLWFKEFGDRLDGYISEQKADTAKYNANREKSFKNLKKLFSDYGLVSGREAEFNFKLALKRNHLLCGGIQFDTLKSNVQKSKKSREYDLILINGNYVGLIEVKRTASIEDIDKLVTEQAISFRIDFPQYKDKILVCFLASYVAIDDVIEKANNLGVGILLQDGFAIKEVISVLKIF